MTIDLRVILLGITTLCQTFLCWAEDQTLPPGQRIDIGGYCLHLMIKGEPDPLRPTIILDHSLGGIEGYLLIESLAKLGRVCIYDRAGYGWSDRSPKPRTSQQIVLELDALLSCANIEPPYVLIGDSFGSYNVRLYAHCFPEKVAGIVFTDGLHETGMLNMPIQLQALKLFFISGFLMSILGSILGIVRVLKTLGSFEWIKPELKHFSKANLDYIKRSFCRPKHWITMSQELWHLDQSGRQVRVANQFGQLPIISIKAKSFFKPSFWTLFLPLRSTNRLREQMHSELLKLSENVTQLQASKSDHFVWVDQPQVMVEGVKIILEKIDCH
ncbi:MAG: alpha/beta hydrolase [Oscillatoriales cyanobacterium RM2_1_1]|nr:alpha/beta hydrolase [Oscillatoriales cyanobacterium SM2_3_0]NJO47307.1 alpha/beta hydrolase [Oscillatoriales cyanobacterium RM2_1_1]